MDKIRQYAAIKKQVTEITARESALKAELKQLVNDSGEVDDKGSYHYDVGDDVSGVKKLMNQRKVSKVFNPDEAERLLTEKGLLERCTVMVPVLDESAILAARYEDLLSDEDIDAMFPAKESFAFYCVFDK